MRRVRRWFFAGLFLVLFAPLGLAQAATPGWKDLQAGDLCLRVPPDWQDITPLVRALILPELLSELGTEGLAIPVAVLRVPPTLEGDLTFLLVILVDAEEFPEFMGTTAADSHLLERWEGVVAGEPGVYTKYEMEDPEGLAWFAYTAQPRADGRHLVLFAFSPREDAVPEGVMRETLLSVQPCPAVPSEPACACEERLNALEQALAALQEKVAQLEREVAELREARALRIGVVDAETLFTRVFLPQVAAERAAVEAKARDIQTLQADYAAGKVKLDAYQQRYLRLQAEYIEAALRVNLVMLDKMIASPGFFALRADLENVRTQARPIRDEVERAVKEAQITILDPQGFSERLASLQEAIHRLDQLLTQVAAVKILEVSQEIALKRGFDLVLRTKDVVIYHRGATVIDLTPEVERRLWDLFPPP